MNKMLFAFAFLCAAPAFAGQDSTASPWKHSLVSALTLTQVSFSNWTQGGENSLSYALSAEGQSTQALPQTNWVTSYKFAFGQARLGDQGLRKTDDKIDIQTILTYKLDTLLNPYVAGTLKSQFAKGYTYDNAGTATEVSAFFDPAYLTQTAGFEYHPIPEVKTRLGAGLREILTSQFTAYSGGKKSEVDGGLESVTEVTWTLDENILLSAKVELFDPFKTMDQVVVRSDNTIAAKVSKFVTVNFNVQLINERKVSPRTQVKQTLALGLSYAIL